MSGVNEIRSTFLNYFGKNGHEIVESASLVPRNDPTLMFTSAGMVPFKNLFTGIETRSYKRATTSQKCLRAGGKHNDLDNVGYTARHHTFFEMLGNFSFGDYFKEEAIYYAWNLVTGEFELPKDKLSITIYHTDDEAFSLWKKISGLPDARIIRIDTSDNFWSMGDTGPCGPCSEIFYDHGPHIPGGPPGSPEADGDRFIEIWNLVFMQYEQLPDGTRVNLPRPSIDTGMGLERISAVMQGTHDNYQTDLMRAMIGTIADLTKVSSEGAQGVSHRVIADHVRAAAFMVADGIFPANEGRGYVARRIMRRGMRHAHLLGAREPLLHRIVPTLVREMGKAYPEIARSEPLICEILELEENRFRKTLERGLVLLDQETRSLGQGNALSGETAFKLYDTYGFPLDLTQDALRPRGIGVDLAGFDAAMHRQKQEARAAWSGTGQSANEAIWFALRDKLGASEFLGYDTLKAEALLTGIIRNGAESASLQAGDDAILLFNQTPFYAESGGQSGDQGLISGEGFLFRVTDTQKRAGNIFAHIGHLESGALTVGTSATLCVDSARRNAIAANHSATHLLHEALRVVLGDHVAQKGSLVGPDRLRFDISHLKPITRDEIQRVEDLANQIVLQNAPVVTRLMAVDEAIASGARALFGEKYGEEVRVVSMGHDEGGNARPYSVELCGGTHIDHTGKIGFISIIGENAVAAGVRRIEAMSGNAARHALTQERDRLRALAGALKTVPEDAETRLNALLEERRKFEKELAEARRQLALGGGSASGGASEIETLNGVALLARTLEGVEAKDLKGLADQYKAQVPSGIIALGAVGEDGRAGVVVTVSADLTARFNAVDLVRRASEALGGKGGGGRPDMAQAGGPDGANMAAAFAAIRAALA